MKRWFWLLAFAGLLFLGRLEHAGTEISDLEPVELVLVYAGESGVRIETDTAAKGSGKDVAQALEDLHAATPATVFLDTAQYLVLAGQAEQCLPQLYGLLRPACYVCLGEEGMDLEQAAAYLRVHPPQVKLLACRAGCADLEKLTVNEGRGQLESGNDHT